MVDREARQHGDEMVVVGGSGDAATQTDLGKELLCLLAASHMTPDEPTHTFHICCVLY